MKREKAITLISLVITIIILIILAGVAVNLSVGENGIFRRAKEAKDKYLTEAEKEQKQLNELYAGLNRGNEPENTPETDAGTRVKVPSGWVTISPNYVSTENGKVVKKMTVSSNVYAVSGGKGVTVPVPEGFYYVGGDIDTGIVISDKKEDGYETTGKDMTSHEDAEKLVGNQFVWIPCTLAEYNKIDFKKENAKWDMETNSAELPQIEKYNGFYIGRYEAGVGTLNKNKKENGTEEEKNNPFDYSITFNGNASLFGAVALQTGINGWVWQNYNFTARRTGTPVTTGSNKVEGNVVVKANSIPYYHADYYTAVEMSRRLYASNNYVKSGLVTGTMWDMMMKYMRDTGKVDITTSNWGNYDNVPLTNLRGYYTNVTSSGTVGATDGFKSVENLPKNTDNKLTTNSGTSSYVLLTTGSTEQVKKMNLYDVAGNLWEWTQEASYIDNLDYDMNTTYNSYMLRGGAFSHAYATHPACFRGYSCAPDANTYRGFRLALYLQ